MTPEELLRQASATSRAAHQQKQIKQQKIRSRQNPHAVALPYDSDRGLQQIQLSDGSIRDAESNSNGVIGEGDTVALHQGKGRSRINAMPHKPKRRQPVTPQSVTTGSVKVLFSDVVAGVRRFFVGGDRQNPVKIFELPSGEFFEAYITNTGRGVNNWIASFRYGFTTQIITKIITPSGQWEYSTPQSAYTIYRGGGFWSSDLIVADISVGDRVQVDNGSAGELICGGTTYTLNSFTITGQGTGPVSPSFLTASVSINGSAIAGNDGGNPPIGITTSLSVTDSRFYETVAFGLYKSEFNSLSGSQTFTGQESASRDCNSSTSSYTQQEDTTGATYIAPGISKNYETFRYSFSQVNSPEVSENSDRYYSSILTGVNSQSAIAQKISQANGQQGSDAGLKLFAKTEDETVEAAITSALPTINLATMNLVGSKIYQVPVSGEYKTKKVEVELDVFAIAGTISQSKKKAPIFSLKSQGCTIHSASAFL